MIANKSREIRRNRGTKMSKKLERLYKDGKCRDCSVVVTRMDFARILGKFTKVKIQYETSSSPKTKQKSDISPNSNSRLKNNENGMVLLPRNAYNQHPVKELLNEKHPIKELLKEKHPIKELLKEKHPIKELLNEKKARSRPPPTPRTNILKENNRLKKTHMINVKSINGKSDEATKVNTNRKIYGIVFVDPITNNSNKEVKNEITLIELLPSINNKILPTEDWCIEFCPKTEECKEDKVYDRIAAELEDLMCSENITTRPVENNDATENKTEDFPSIMDILNENITKPDINAEQSSAEDFKANLESSDVEAMLLGKSNDDTNKIVESSPMVVDNTDMSTLIDDVAQLNNSATDTSIENPQSPSILDEAIQKGVEENMPLVSLQNDDSKSNIGIKPDGSNLPALKPDEITHVLFKKNVNGICHKTVTCPKNLIYSIEIEGNAVEFIGAPKAISSSEDLQVLLQIVNESQLDSLYVTLNKLP